MEKYTSITSSLIFKAVWLAHHHHHLIVLLSSRIADHSLTREEESAYDVLLPRFCIKMYPYKRQVCCKFYRENSISLSSPANILSRYNHPIARFYIRIMVKSSNYVLLIASLCTVLFRKIEKSNYYIHKTLWYGGSWVNSNLHKTARFWGQIYILNKWFCNSYSALIR